MLDEADRLLDTGSRDELMKLFRMMPKSGTGQDRLQVLLFSATLHSPEIKELANVLCQNPVWVDLKGRDFVPETVDHVCVVVDPREDRSWLQAAPRTYTDNAHKHDDPPGPNSSSREAWSEAVKRLKPRVLQRLIDQHNMQQCLIFCRTNFDCDNLEKFLNELGGGRAFKGEDIPLQAHAAAPTQCCGPGAAATSSPPTRAQARWRRAWRTPIRAWCWGARGPWRSVGATCRRSRMATFASSSARTWLRAASTSKASLSSST